MISCLCLAGEMPICAGVEALAVPIVSWLEESLFAKPLSRRGGPVADRMFRSGIGVALLPTFSLLSYLMVAERHWRHAYGTRAWPAMFSPCATTLAP